MTRSQWLCAVLVAAAMWPPSGAVGGHGNAFEWIEDCHEPDHAH